MLSTRSRLRVLSEIMEEENSLIGAVPSPQEDETLKEARRERRRQKLVTELIESEKMYLHHLELVHKFFDFPLRFACIVPDNVHLKLFSNIEQIWEVNTKLLEHMEQSTVGQAFIKLGPFLKLYSTYANSHEHALSTLQEWQQKSPEFADFIQFQESRPEVKGLKLNALLITPVQRVPRYKMLLENMLQHTRIDYHDYQALKESAQQVSDIAHHINEHIRQHENFQKMLTIQNSLVGSSTKILSPGRQFIKEGLLKKVSRKGGQSNDRMFFLFSDMLLYAKPKRLDAGKSYHCSCVLPLKHCTVERVFANMMKSDGGGMFKVTCKDESLLLYADAQESVKSWIEALEQAIRKFCNNRQTLRKPSSQKIPLRGRLLMRARKIEKKEDPQRKRTLSAIQEDDCLSPRVRATIQQPFNAIRNMNASCLSPMKRPRLRDNRENSNDENVQQDIPSTDSDRVDNIFMNSKGVDLDQNDASFNMEIQSLDSSPRLQRSLQFSPAKPSNVQTTSPDTEVCGTRTLNRLSEQKEQMTGRCRSAVQNIQSRLPDKCCIM